MADTVQQDGQQIPEQRQDGIRFAESFLFYNKTLGDIYQGERNYNLPVWLEPKETFTQLINTARSKSGKEEASEEEIDKLYSEISILHGLYKERRFNPYKLNGEYDYGTGSLNEEGALKYFMPDDSFLQTGPTNTRYFYGVEPVKINADQQRAEDLGVVKDKNGVLTDKGVFDKRLGTNRLSLEFSDDVGSYIWKELGDGKLGDPDSLRSPNFLGGANELNSSWIGSAVRGLFGGMVGKTYQGAAGVAHLLNAIGSGTASIFSDKTYHEISLNNDWNYMANEMSNFASSLSRQNEDEKGHFYEGANAFMYGFWDGVGQFIPMIASGFTLGAAGVGTKLATQLSIAIGSMTVYDLTRNELINKGYDAGVSDGIGLLFGAITHGSENVLAGNLVQRFGVRLGRNMTEKMPARLLGEAIEEMGESGGKSYLSGTAQKIAADLPSSKWMATKYTSKINKWLRDPLTKEYKSKWVKGAATALRAGTEEGTEEAIEGITQAGVGSLFNNTQKRIAANNLKQWGGYDFPRN